MDNRAIGVFDSGLGGLTAMRQLKLLLPNEHFIFLGDTARLPYGGRSSGEVRKLARDDMDFLISQNVKCIAAACGTVSSNILESDLERYDVPFIGLIKPTAEAALTATRSGRIGVIATKATVASGAFRKALKTADPDIKIFSTPCPDLVPLIESGATVNDRGSLEKAVAGYLQPLMAKRIDTLILGCTHYPLISDIISDITGANVTLIDSGAAEAYHIASHIHSSGLAAPEESTGCCEYYVTSKLDQFCTLAHLFLGEDVSGNAFQLTEAQFYNRK